MIRLCIREWVGRSGCLQTTAEHDVIWSIWAGDRGDYYPVHTWTENATFTPNFVSWSMRFDLSSWLSTRTPLSQCCHRFAPNAVWLPGCQIISMVIPILRIFFSRYIDDPSFQPLSSGNSPLCTIPLWQIFDQNREMFIINLCLDNFLMLSSYTKWERWENKNTFRWSMFLIISMPKCC